MIYFKQAILLCSLFFIGVIMCSIVKNPTKQENFLVAISESKSPEIAKKIVGLCEETHIPQKATELVLKLIEVDLAGKPTFSIPFAIYGDGKRIVSSFSTEYEKAVMHLAMAGSTLFYINQELKTPGKEIVMGHCCEIRLHDTNQSDWAMRLAHDDNVYRADNLRSNPETIVLGDQGFLGQIDSSQKRFWELVLSGEKALIAAWNADCVPERHRPHPHRWGSFFKNF